jgi:DNA-binding CsgD family transcriptional regulator/tetratricopeptide (TPR) repeat protein
MLAAVSDCVGGSAGWLLCAGIDRRDADWWAGLVEGSVVFVGRGRELDRLQDALAGDVRLLLVVGDAGMGKTRFAGEGMRRAVGGGAIALWGGCLPLAEKLPLLPVAQALGELSRLAGGRLLETALGMVPSYVRADVARLVPRLGPGGPDEGGQGGEWQRERLYSGVAELLAAVARRSVAGLVVEDVHWADTATLDCLTFLLRAQREARLTVVATCRSDEVPLDAQVAGWLAQVRGSAAVEEIRLGPLSRGEVGEQVAALAGGPALGGLADEVYARGEGNPFFTEQLVAAALAGPAGGAAEGVGGVPRGLPARLAELLLARADRCSGQAQEVLAALAVAGRPLTEAALGEVAGLSAAAVRSGLRELAAARLLAEDTAGGAHRPRHALLAEAVAGALLPGERVTLHERTARVLESVGDETLAAEAAGHWTAAAQPAQELPARLAAGRAAERVFGYPQAAAHFLRAIDLCRELPGAAWPAGIDLPRLYVQAVDALEISGDGEHARALAVEAHRRFAGHADRDTAAAIHLRVATFRILDEPAAAFHLTEEAIRLSGQGPPSAGLAEAWYRYGSIYPSTGEGDREASQAAFLRALEIAEASGAAALVPQAWTALAEHAFERGDVEEGFALIDRARALAEASGDGRAIVSVALAEATALDRAGKKQAAVEVALNALRVARQTGREGSLDAEFLAGNACSGMIECGRTAEAAELIGPLTTGKPERRHPYAHLCRAELDILRGDMEAARGRLQRIKATLLDRAGLFSSVTGLPLLMAELASWTGRPAEALEEVTRALPAGASPPIAYLCGPALVAGMRACADLAERARARRDGSAVAEALTAADGLTSWVDQVAGAPFTDHPALVYIPADRARWAAECGRLAGKSDPAAWGAAAKAWDGLGWPHRAGYAWWRQAQAELDAGLPAAVAAGALQAAAVAAEGHAPLLAQIRALAERARIPLQARQAGPSASPRPVGQATPYGLTTRELAVLRLLAAGRTNAQIGADLYISPKTAGVHVSNILRKLGAANRVQAAALAERAGLLGAGQP